MRVLFIQRRDAKRKILTTETPRKQKDKKK